MNKEEIKTFGGRVRLLREKVNMSRDELAKRIGIATPTLAGYENNLREPKFQTIQEIANALNTSSDYLLCITDNPKPNKASNDLKVLVKSMDGLNVNGKKLSNRELKMLIQFLETMAQNEDETSATKEEMEKWNCPT